mgnify:CR=1 FL=1
MRPNPALPLMTALLLVTPLSHAQNASPAEASRAGTFKQVQGEAWIGSPGTQATQRRSPQPGNTLCYRVTYPTRRAGLGKSPSCNRLHR